MQLMILDANMLHNQLYNTVKHVAYQSARTRAFLYCNNFPTLFRIEKKRKKKKNIFEDGKKNCTKKKFNESSLSTPKKISSLSFPKTHPKHSLPNILLFFICKLTNKQKNPKLVYILIEIQESVRQKILYYLLTEYIPTCSTEITKEKKLTMKLSKAKICNNPLLTTTQRSTFHVRNYKQQCLSEESNSTSINKDQFKISFQSATSE